MSGDATFSGTGYQAGVMAFVSVHALMEQPLAWTGLPVDQPYAIAGEVGGAGDDIRIEVDGDRRRIDVQAKHGLQAGAALTSLLEQMGAASADAESGPIVLVVNRGSTQWLHQEFARDLQRLRSGRADAATTRTRELQAALSPRAAQVLRRLHLIAVDVDNPADPERRLATTSLAGLLEFPEQAEAAWRVLCSDMADVCARKLRRTRADLVALLASHGFNMRPPEPFQRLHKLLDISKTILNKWKPTEALVLLDEIEKAIKGSQADGFVVYRCHQQRAAALHQLRRDQESLASARRALEQDPNGLYALVVAASAAMSLGDIELARDFAMRATKWHPQSPQAWLVKVQFETYFSPPVESIPSDILRSAEFRIGLAEMRLTQGNGAAALELTDELLREGRRPPEVLALRAQALLTTVDGGTAAFDSATAREVERLCSEVIADTESSDASLRIALLARAVAARSLGRPNEGDGDIKRALAIEVDNPHAVVEAAEVAIIDGDYEGAVRVLSGTEVERYPALLALRGEALAHLDRKELAKGDIEKAIRELSTAFDPDAVRLFAASAATAMHDLALAERALEGLSKKGLTSSRYQLTRGRILLLKGDVESAITAFENAAELDDKMAPGLYAELGSRLVAVDRPADAVIAFDKSVPLPAKAEPSYLQALIRSRALVRANELLTPHLKTQNPPDWVLDGAAHLALIREDFEGAVELLRQLAERDRATSAARLELARLLVHLKRIQEAQKEIRLLSENTSALSPKQQMFLAHLRYRAGDAQEAMTLAFGAFRRGPDDPELHRGLAGLALASRIAPTVPTEIGPDTYVKLSDEQGDTVREYVIYASPPANPMAHEILMSGAQAVGLVGLKLGDALTLDKGTWQEQRLTVVEIKSALHHVVQDILAHYEQRFPRSHSLLRDSDLRQRAPSHSLHL